MCVCVCVCVCTGSMRCGQKRLYVNMALPLAPLQVPNQWHNFPECHVNHVCRLPLLSVQVSEPY